MKNITVIGAGLAGCEAAFLLARLGFCVDLIEMKPQKYTPAHHSPDFGELVCSNSLRAAGLTNAAGLLKEELRRLGSVIITSADQTAVEAGGALAVDRQAFSKLVTQRINDCENINVIGRCVEKIPTDSPVIIATGPLTDDALAQDIAALLGSEYLAFYDAAAPIVAFESIDMTKAFFASRYDKGSADYINCPMTQEEYLAFYNQLITAGQAPVHGFENSKVFEGCMPVETMAARGLETLRFGPLKPVGIRHPQTGQNYHAIVQLRKDNAVGSMYNMVGFQTHLKFGEQKRVFSMIPGLENAEFLRYGVMHKNSFINSPKLLDNTYALRQNPNIAFAGQITGVEGYIESAASGYLAALQMARRLQGKPAVEFTSKTAIGALANYVSNPAIEKFQPMNINYGIIDPVEYKIKGKDEKKLYIADRSFEIINSMGDL